MSRTLFPAAAPAMLIEPADRWAGARKGSRIELREEQPYLGSTWEESGVHFRVTVYRVVAVTKNLMYAIQDATC